MASLLEQLPLEVRQQIYHETLVDDDYTEVIRISLRGKSAKRKLESHAFSAIHGLALANRTISNEVLDYCFGRFAFCLIDKTRSFRLILREFYRQIGPQNRKIVRRIIIPHFSPQRMVDGTLPETPTRCEPEHIVITVLSEFRAGVRILSYFPALIKIDLGLHISECLPHPRDSNYPCVFRDRYSDFVTGAYPTWEVDELEPSLILRTLEDMQIFGRRIELGISWTDFWPDQDTAYPGGLRNHFLMFLKRHTRLNGIKDLGKTPAAYLEEVVGKEKQAHDSESSDGEI